MNFAVLDPREKIRGTMQRFKDTFVIMWVGFAGSSVVTVEVAFLVFLRPFGRLQKLFAYYCGVLATAWLRLREIVFIGRL